MFLGAGLGQARWSAQGPLCRGLKKPRAPSRSTRPTLFHCNAMAAKGTIVAGFRLFGSKGADSHPRC
jgi:hypothetical protein